MEDFEATKDDIYSLGDTILARRNITKGEFQILCGLAEKLAEIQYEKASTWEDVADGE